tara:strand:+ start:815 stop:1330 length:516 start_codon:yes stop_codon:yes gene_type:complete
MAAQFATENGDNPLWHHAIDLYGRPGVKECVLQLQNDFGVDVVMLLANQWLSSQGASWPAESDLIDYLSWREQMVVPLRSVRQQLTKDSEPLRSQLLKAELSAEQEAIRRLYLALAEERRDASSAAVDSVLELSALFFSDKRMSGTADISAAQKKEAIRPLFQRFAALTSD